MMGRRCLPKHLVAAVYQKANLVAYYPARFADVRVLAGAVVDGCANTVTADYRALRIHEIYYESKLLQALDAFFDRWLVRFHSAEEHVTYYNARVPFLLSLDEGTTSARAALYDEHGYRLAMESAPIQCRYPQSGWVEQDAEEIWRSQLDAARRTLAHAREGAQSIAAIGITNQRETTIVWDRKTGKPVAPAIVWQCRRTAAFCAELGASPVPA